MWTAEPSLDENTEMLGGGEASPFSQAAMHGRFTVRLVGDADAVGWVAENLRTQEIGVETSPLGGPVAVAEPSGPIVWVARPGQHESGRPVVDDAAVWSF